MNLLDLLAAATATVAKETLEENRESYEKGISEGKKQGMSDDQLLELAFCMGVTCGFSKVVAEEIKSKLKGFDE